MNIHYKQIRRVVITGSYSDDRKPFNWLIKNGYRITRSGPKHIRGREFSTEFYKIIAEKEVPYERVERKGRGEGDETKTAI